MGWTAWGTGAAAVRMGAALSSIATTLTATTLTATLAAAPAQAARATLVVEADSGAVLHADQPNLRSFPASTTKLMTLYLVFEALAKGELSLDEDLPVSAHAAAQGGQSMNLREGGTIKARDAIFGTIVESANDAAVVLAERIGGTEEAFAGRMTEKAQALGMTRSRFRNASGLNHPEQTVTARDMAVLARALMRDFPDRYALFGTRGFTHGRWRYATVNSFLVNYSGADGLKTGFTCAAGYNLVASAVRDGRRLIAVVLGETSRGERAETVAQLMSTGFARQAWEDAKSLDGLAPEATGEPDPPAQGVIAESCAAVAAVAGVPAVSGGRAAGWSVEIGGAFRNRALASAAGTRVLAREASLKGGRLSVLPAPGGARRFRPVIAGLGETAAQSACRKLRGAKQPCTVLSPALRSAAVDRAAPIGRSFRTARNAARTVAKDERPARSRALAAKAATARTAAAKTAAAKTIVKVAKR